MPLRLRVMLLVCLISGAGFGQAEMKITRNIPYAEMKGVRPNLLSLDIYAPKTGEKHPVMVMIHGGGWSIGDKSNRGLVHPKADYFVENGYVFVSINYRLSPAIKHPEHVKDVAKALAWVHNHIKEYGGDPNQLFIMGHSAGAHLAALVAIDERYLKAEKKNLKILRGVILLDGAGYDIPKAMKFNGGSKMYRDAFGDDEKGWKDASPITHIAPKKNIPPFLIFYAGRRIASERISKDLANALEKVGVKALVAAAPDKNHAQMNQDIGTGDEATKTVMAFLKSIN